MEKSICLNCGAPFDQTPGKREKKFCKPSCRVSHCQKNKRKADFALKTKQPKKQTKPPLSETKVIKEKVVKKVVPKLDQDKHGAGKIVKEAVQKKEVKSPAASSFLEQRRKQKLG